MEEPTDTSGLRPDGLPFRSALADMPQERLAELVARALKRLEELRAEMGWSLVPGSCSGWMGLRERWLWQWEDDWEYRKKEPDSIWQHVNHALNECRRGCRRVIARATADLLGTTPWFVAMPEGAQDIELANQINRRSQWKFRQMKVDKAAADAVQWAPILGERVVKLRYENDVRKFKTYDEVLVGQDKKPIKCGDQYITPGDWQPHPDDIKRVAQAMAAAADGAIDPAQIPPALQVCKHDLTLAKQQDTLLRVVGYDESAGWQFDPEPVAVGVAYHDTLIPKTVTVSKGPVGESCHFRSFFAPLNAPDLQKADCVIHTYSMSVSEVARRHGRPDLLKKLGAPSPFTSWIKEIAGRVKTLLSLQSTAAKDTLDQPTYQRGEEEVTSMLQTQSVKRCLLADVCIHFDADGDGQDEDVLLVLLLDDTHARSAEPLYWNYVGDVYPKARRPFEVVPFMPVEGRWWGQGVFELYRGKQDAIEEQHARIQFANSMAGLLKLFNRHLLEDKEAKFEVGRGKVYYGANDQVKIDDVFQTKRIIEPDEQYYKLLNEERASLALELGLLNEAEGQNAGIPSSDTATGVTANERSGDELADLWMRPMEEGLTSLIQALVRLDYWYMDAVETFEYLEGKSTKVGELRRHMIANLDMDARILMTRRKNRMTLNNNNEATKIISDWKSNVANSFQLGIAPEKLDRERFIYVDQLKALDIQDADELLTKAIDMNPPPPPPGPASANGPKQPPEQPTL